MAGVSPDVNAQSLQNLSSFGQDHGVVMDSILARLQTQIAELEDELERELQHRRQLFNYTLKKKKAHFEAEILAQHRKLKQNVYHYLRTSPLRNIITAPVIYALIVPFALLDLMVTLYQAICFRAYGIPQVKRSRYVIIDRHRLPYLNAIEKINCVYCGYANGVIAYVREVASRTEQYWCPIKHTRRVRSCHHRYYDFIDYGDADGFKTRMKDLRKALREEEKAD